MSRAATTRDRARSGSRGRTAHPGPTIDTSPAPMVTTR
ncbi:MAG: hypothetical protein JWR62_3374, partial [Modestobacter sp.]|nr:hypothetical protein [Modestobacter sp.]